MSVWTPQKMADPRRNRRKSPTFNSQLVRLVQTEMYFQPAGYANKAKFFARAFGLGFARFVGTNSLNFSVFT
jgi:hypothetical protein